MSKQDKRTKPLRRRYEAAFKRELVERSLQAGASVSGIALENGINANVLFKWRREHFGGAAGVREGGPEQAVLLPVRLSARVTPTKPEAGPASAPMSAGVIEVDMGCARVRLRGSVDPGSVRCVLQALKALA